MTTIRKRIASLLAAALCLSLLVPTAGAYARVDVDQPVSLTLNFYDKERSFAFEGMEVSIYKVLDMTDAVRFIPDVDGPFASYNDKINWQFPEESEIREPGMTEEAFETAWTNAWKESWDSLTSTLVNYLSADDSITPTATREVAVVNKGADNETGQVVFDKDSAGKELKPGVYLVIPAGITDGRYTYIPESYLVSLPNLDNDSNWDYSVAIQDKFERDYDPPGSGGTTINRNVLKVWEDGGSEDRPVSVTVRLLRDGEVFDEVELSEDNDWRYSWTGLSRDYEWTLVEVDVPSDYTVEIVREGTTFVVTNSTDDTPGTTPPTTPPTTTPSTEPPTEEIPDDSTPLDPGPPEAPSDETIIDGDVPLGSLPQTGTLWMPVQILAVVGILLFSIGWLDMRRQKRHEK